ncbi:hypothetical protein EI94DRAFT_529388 [Lactarius quietus]|nr:hypothetical protein EI94DRAFT_529388 [Lactarius quietus]
MSQGMLTLLTKEQFILSWTPSMSVPTRLMSHPPANRSLISSRILSIFDFLVLYLCYKSARSRHPRCTWVTRVGDSFPPRRTRAEKGHRRLREICGPPRSGKFMRRWRKEDKEDVIETLSERADGMFRWVFCQLEMLRNCLPQNVRRALRELPSTLDETYERMLWDILKANPDQAYRLLQCLTVAVRPLRVNELAEVLALNFDETEGGIPVLNKDWKWDDEEQGVLSTCSSLVVIVDDDNYPRTRVVQFAHFSVKEFLTSDRLSNLKADISRFHIRLEPAHTVVAQACMAILLSSDDNDLASRDPTDLPRSPSESPRSVYSMYNPEKPWDPWADHAQFENVADSDSTDLPRSPYKSPLSKYIMEHWVGHAQFENVSSHIEDGMRCLFNPAKPHFAAWLSRSFNFRPYLVKPFFRGDSLDTILMKRDCPLESTSASEDNAPCCLYYAALYGFRDLTKYLIHKYPQHVNATVDLDGRPTPLAAALSNGHVQVAELLLQHGAVLHIGYQGRTLLHAASKDGLIDVTQWLLEHSVDANVQDDDHSTPLHWAARYGRLELVRTLLEHGGDVNATTALDNHTPLHKASEGGHFEVVQLLIQNGADVTTDLQGLLLLAYHRGVPKLCSSSLSSGRM